MRITSLAPLALLPALCAAVDGSAPAPALTDRLSALWDAVTPYLPTKAPSLQAPAMSLPTPNPVVKLNSSNFASALGGVPASALSAGPIAASDAQALASPWLIVVTGGNATCGGRCAQLDAAWDLATLQLRGPNAPRLARLDCEAERRLCATVGAQPATAWWVAPQKAEVKRADTTAAKVTAREAEVEGAERLEIKTASVVETSRPVWVVEFNTTTVGADEIARLYRKAEWKVKGQLYETESLLSRQPFDGRLARWGVLEYVGWAFFAASVVPGWTFVMMASVTIRMWLSRRALPKESREQKAERERKEKYTADGKVRGAPPGDGRSAGPI